MNRQEQSTRRLQYELPGMAAGMVMVRLDHAERMIGLGRMAEALADLARAGEEARAWQRWAAASHAVGCPAVRHRRISAI